MLGKMMNTKENSPGQRPMACQILHHLSFASFFSSISRTRGRPWDPGPPEGMTCGLPGLFQPLSAPRLDFHRFFGARFSHRFLHRLLAQIFMDFGTIVVPFSLHVLFFLHHFFKHRFCIDFSSILHRFLDAPNLEKYCFYNRKQHFSKKKLSRNS